MGSRTGAQGQVLLGTHKAWLYGGRTLGSPLTWDASSKSGIKMGGWGGGVLGVGGKAITGECRVG